MERGQDSTKNSQKNQCDSPQLGGLVGEGDGVQ